MSTEVSIVMDILKKLVWFTSLLFSVVRFLGPVCVPRVNRWGVEGRREFGLEKRKLDRMPFPYQLLRSLVG